MAKKTLMKLLRGDSMDVPKTANLLFPRPMGVRESESSFQSLYKKSPLM